MEDVKWVLIGITSIAGVLLFFSLPDLLRQTRKSMSNKKKIKNGEFVKTTAIIMGVLKATEWVHEANIDEAPRSYKAEIHEKYVILEFALEDGSLVREKSRYAMRANIDTGEIVKIAYNPKDLKEIYLLD